MILVYMNNGGTTKEDFVKENVNKLGQKLRELKWLSDARFHSDLKVGDQVTHNSRKDLGIGEIVEILPDGRIAVEFRNCPQTPVHTDKPYATFTGIPPLSVTKARR